MKNIYTFLALSMIVLLTSCGTTRDYAQGNYPQSPDITYQQFYDGLSPYGNWVDYQNYGYVWVPDEQGFRPYYNNGHWVYTNYGWTWVSNYNWGWAPFHYGRWLYDDAYGWMWVPGYEWAPAWVSWRSGGGCYGWAPLAPGLDVSFGSRIPYNHWAFVPNRYINNPRINNYYIAPEKNVTIINNTTVINNTRVINNTNTTNNKTVYVVGPSATEVEKVTNEKIRPAKVVQTNTPGNTKASGSVVSIYKPAVRERPQQNQQIRPSKIVKLDELKVRRVNTGAAQNEVPGKEILQKPATPVNEKPGAPVNSNPEPALNTQKNNTVAPVNEKTNPVIEKQVPVTQPQKVIPVQKTPEVKQENVNEENNNDKKIRNAQQNNPVNNNPEPAINTQKNNTAAPLNEKTNPVIEKQVPVTQPQKVVPVQKTPEVKQENVNEENNNDKKIQNAQQNNPVNKQPAVINNQPAKVRVISQPNKNLENERQNIPPTAPVNTAPVKTRQVSPVRPQRSQPSPDTRQMNRTPVTRTPVIRNISPQESRPTRTDIPTKERR